ncbi:uncharacterized protein LOC9638268 isoform X1 [Selaginella moellendorffii]|uniref:uncharacterized protein LOC9638268 isoform X1 n=1 Tax=Selaginella moellendorffii TaxID=88036 RepID=UPI000D1CB625|nr:uncharacterized protein LOC9638268 isoform X1 [Selaginella moellendorffii]|eukprot:XP_024533932.1 uncharacterized protein LOC9638268 isoform X1 [Selaginella moellendorffii]
MLSEGETTLAMAAGLTTVVQNGCVDEAAGVFVSTAEAKAPWNKDEAANGAAECSKSKARDGLLELLNKSGVPPAAQRMALNILVKLVRTEAGRFETHLFAKILCSLIESKGTIATPLDCLASKYFVYGDTRCCVLDRIHQLAKSISEGGTRGIELLKVLYGYLFDKNPLTSACLAAPEFEQKAAVLESDKQFLEQITAFCSALATELNGQGDGCLRNASVLRMPQLISSLVEEKTNGRCKASVADNALQDPEKTVNGEDLSALVLTAARGRGSEANTGGAVRAGTPKKKVSDEDEVENEEEEEDGGGESGGDEGDSDDPDHGGNEEEEEGEEEEEEEEEDGEEEEEDGEQQQGVGSNAAPTAAAAAAAARNNNAIASVDGAPGFDEEEEESDQDGGVEDDGEGADGGEDEEDDDGDDDEDGAPPLKKAKK